MKKQTLKALLSLSLFSFVYSHSMMAQSVGISTSTFTPDPSAILEIQSGNKGVLVPQVSLTGTTDAATIASPAISLLIFNTASAGSGPSSVVPGYYYNGGTPESPQWIRLLTADDLTGGGGNQWSGADDQTGDIGRAGAVGVGTTTPNASAGLDVDFTNKGFLPPRLNTAQRNAIPGPLEAGLLIYNTDISCIEFYNGSSWFSPCISDNCSSAPSTPVQNGYVNVSISSIEWNWIASPGAVRYRVNSVNDISTSTIVPTNTYQSESLSCGTTHNLFIWAENACGFSIPLQMSSTLSCCPSPGMLHEGGYVISSTQSPCSGFIKSAAPTSPATWSTANSYCQNLTAGGHSDWELPNTPSLSQLNGALNNGTITLDALGLVSTWFWSSTPGAGGGEYNWFYLPSVPDNIAPNIWMENNQYYFCVRPF